MERKKEALKIFQKLLKEGFYDRHRFESVYHGYFKSKRDFAYSWLNGFVPDFLEFYILYEQVCQRFIQI